MVKGSGMEIREDNGGGDVDHDHNLLYTCMKLSKKKE